MAGRDLYGMSVLVVDDDPLERDLITSLLQDLGVTDVRRAPDGARALEILRQFTPDFVICDILMENMDGIEFTRAVRTDRLSANPYLPIFILTGDTQIEAVRDARDAGANGFLAKPVTAEVLQDRVIAALAERREFIRSDDYTGPDRRRRDLPLGGRTDRRRE